MKRYLLKSSNLTLLAAVLSILSIACDTAVVPAATPEPTTAVAVTPVPIPALAAAPSQTSVPVATAVPAHTSTTTPMPTPISPATPAPTPEPPATPAPTPGPPATPVPTPGLTAISFNPDLVSLASIGSSATITVESAGVDSGTQGVQINVQHSAELQVSSPACAGIFTGGNQLGPASATGGTVIGCVLLASDVSGPAGAVMTFQLTRIGNFDTDQVVSFGVGGPLGTMHSDSGINNVPGITNQLTVRP